MKPQLHLRPDDAFSVMKGLSEIAKIGTQTMLNNFSSSVQNSSVFPFSATWTNQSGNVGVLEENAVPTVRDSSHNNHSSPSKVADTDNHPVEEPKVGSRKTEQTLNIQSKQSSVPTSKYSRMARYAALGIGLGLGALGQIVRKGLGIQNEGGDFLSSNPFVTEANAERLVKTLCRMRGAALKVGQMISIQDEALVPPELLQIFERVRKGADFMPAYQMNKILVQELGSEWRSKLQEFDDTPIAAASIGQVHRAVLLDGREVAMKIQYPGIADSIDSDIQNLMTLLKLSNSLPEGMYIEKTMENAKRELCWETDYIREAKCQKKFKQLLQDDEHFIVPSVIDDLSSRGVITSEMIYGCPLEQLFHADQSTRDFIAFHILRLCLRELFEYNFMQTDPNWANFFYDKSLRRIGLLDFGASRYYGTKFTDEYIQVIKCATVKDIDGVLEHSKKMGFLTGMESPVMLHAHAEAVLVLGEPFAATGIFDFSGQNITSRIHSLIPTMLKHRLTPPPDESYSLHRKLSGAFLLAAKLRAKIPCKDIFDSIYGRYRPCRPLMMNDI